MSAQFASAEADDHAARAAPLFTPFRVGALDLRNRIAMAPMSRYLCPHDKPHDAVAAYYARRARHGVGLIITEGTYIGHPSAPSYAGVPHFAGDALDDWAKARIAVHAAGGRIFPQLWHTGSFRARGMAPDPAVPGVSPSGDANPLSGSHEPTRAMTDADIAAVIEAYAEAAAAAQSLGFDGVEIHAAHGYLIDEFFWAKTNRRSDRYGGDIADRSRFAVEIIQAIRARVGASFPISLRFSQWKQQDYTAKLAETPYILESFLAPLADAGLSLLHCSTRRALDRGFPEHGDLSLAGWTKKLTGLPVIAVGSIGLDRPGLKDAAPASIDAVAERLALGEFDLVAVGRALLADAEWVEKVRAGRVADCASYSKELLSTLR